MTITSLVFFGFVIGSILLYWLLPGKLRTAWLLIISLVFCATWSLPFTVILILLSLLNFLLGRQMFRSLENRNKSIWLWLGLIFNLAFLILVRYLNFFIPQLIERINTLSSSWNTGSLTILVPIGVSFIFVQCVIYMLDIYHRRIPADARLTHFLVYILYFPKLLSGPIERPKPFLAQLDNPKPVNKEIISKSLTLIGVGLLRKLIIADPLTALIQSDSFVRPVNVPLVVLLFDLLAYAFALYNDFAGYSSIVRGVSLLFGIELNQNFNLPYFAHNFNEFWSRWHISLSDALRDYVYFPLSRWLAVRIPRRNHALNLILPPMVTMLVSGLWHGFGWNMLIWGGLHGLYQVIERVRRLRKNYRPIHERRKIIRGFSIVLVFILVLIAWIPFRMDLSTAGQFISSLIPTSARLQPYLDELYLLRHGDLTANWLNLLPNIRLLTLLIVAFIPDLVHYFSKDELNFLHWPVWLKSLALCALILALMFISLATYRAPFVYQGF